MASETFTLVYKQIEYFYSIIKNLEIRDIFFTFKKNDPFVVLECINSKTQMICSYKIEILEHDVTSDFFVNLIPLSNNMLLNKNNDGKITFIFKNKDIRQLIIKTKYSHKFYTELNNEIVFNTINNLSHSFDSFDYYYKKMKNKNTVIGKFLIKNTEIKDLLKMFSEKSAIKIYKEGIIKFEGVMRKDNPISQKKTFILEKEIDDSICFDLDKSFLSLKSLTINLTFSKIKIFETIEATLFYNNSEKYYYFVFNSNKSAPVTSKSVPIPMNELVKIYIYEQKGFIDLNECNAIDI